MKTETERLAVLEIVVEHLEKDVHDMKHKIDEIHEVLLQAKGVRWVVVTTIGIVAFVTSVAYYVAGVLHIR